jgi:uncharacterized protein with PQ loop repeat
MKVYMKKNDEVIANRNDDSIRSSFLIMGFMGLLAFAFLGWLIGIMLILNNMPIAGVVVFILWAVEWMIALGSLDSDS